MAETRFIKTVVFGGYDKADVDKKLEFLYTQYYDMKNSLREAKLMLNKYKEGAGEEAVMESVLANERAKLTEFQVKNEAMSESLKSIDDDNKNKEKEIAELKAKLQETEEQLKDANSKLAASSGNDAAMLGVVFAEAQKSANMIIQTAQKQANDMEADSKKLAENTVTDANNKAMKIIYEAEVNAAKITADAENASANMQAASGNLKASMLADVNRLSADMANLKKLLAQFQTDGMSVLDESEKLLSSTKAELTAGGVPVFKEPSAVEAKMPAVPEYAAVDNTYNTGVDEAEKKKNEELDKLKAMAGALGGKPKEEPKPAAPAAEAPKSGGTSLDDLLKKAKSIK